MDFFDDLVQAVEKSGRRRGVRVAPEVWQAFSGAVKRPAASAPVRPARPIPERPEFKRQVPPPAAASSLAPPPPMVSIPEDWEALRNMVHNCRRCRLAETRINVVFGEGDAHARLMFIGEGPGAEEDATGRPFVGAAGQLLDKMIAAMQLSREAVYIANVVKCRPPGNRNPGDDEAAECLGYLRAQIRLVKPEVIVLLGGTALRFVLRMDGIMRARGRWFEYEGIPVMPTFHPAFLLRKAEAKRDAWNDLKQVMAKLGINRK